MPAAAQEKIARGALLLDIRRSTDLEKTGRAKGSHHFPRGMLEFRADPASPCHDPQMRPDRAVVLHCASGGRVALAGKLLTDMGYAEVCNPGGFKDWKDAGGPMQGPVDPGICQGWLRSRRVAAKAARIRARGLTRSRIKRRARKLPYPCNGLPRLPHPG